MNSVTTRNIMLKLNEWRKSGVKCDIILIIGEQEFHAHKHVLAAAVKFFEKLFTSDFAEKEKNAITLKDVDPDGFRLLLDYIYTGEIKIDDDNFEQVLSVADYYQIECLIKKLFDYATSNININNGFYYYRSAYSVGNEKIKEFSKEFIRNDFLSCSNSAVFLDITHPILLEFIDSSIKDELDRFKIIMKWIRSDWNNRSDYLSDLIKNVHFAYISNDVIVENILDCQLVINNLEIIKAIKERKKLKHTLKIYGMNGSDLIRLDIVNAKLEATHMIVKTKVYCDKFQIVSSTDGIFVSIFRNGYYGNRLYRFKNHQWTFLTDCFCDLTTVNRSIVWSKTQNTIYVNNLESIYFYRSADLKGNFSDESKRIKSMYGSLNCYNDFIYAIGSCSDGMHYILRCDPTNKTFYLKSQLLECFLNTVSAILDDKMFIISGGLVQMYDIAKDQCTVIEDNKQRIIPYHSLIAYQNQLYAIREKWDVIDVFDPSKMSWTEEIRLETNGKRVFNMK